MGKRPWRCQMWKRALRAGEDFKTLYPLAGLVDSCVRAAARRPALNPYESRILTLESPSTKTEAAAIMPVVLLPVGPCKAKGCCARNDPKTVAVATPKHPKSVAVATTIT